MQARERIVEYYRPHPGTPGPFGVWRDSIADIRLKAAVTARIARLQGGNFSDSKSIGGGALESRIDFGPGYRIYYGVEADKIILLCGGDKSAQDSDIETAKTRWSDYVKRRKQNAKKPELQNRSARRPKK